jgi:hypothetical protein
MAEMLRHIVKVKISSNLVIFMLKYTNIEITINISKHLEVFYHDLEIHTVGSFATCFQIQYIMTGHYNATYCFKRCTLACRAHLLHPRPERNYVKIH